MGMGLGSGLTIFGLLWCLYALALYRKARCIKWQHEAEEDVLKRLAGKRRRR